MKSLTRVAKPDSARALIAVESRQLPATTPLEQNFADAFAKWHASAMDYAEWLLDDYDRAADVVSEVSARVFRQWEKLPLESKTMGYFITAVHNEAIDELRRLKRRVELTDDVETQLSVQEMAPFPPVDQATGDIDAAFLIERAIARLPRQCKIVFQLRRVQGLSRKVTTEVTGLPAQTISNYLARADALVRAALVRAGVQVKDGIISLRLPSGAEREP